MLMQALRATRAVRVIASTSVPFLSKRGGSLGMVRPVTKVEYERADARQVSTNQSLHHRRIERLGGGGGRGRGGSVGHGATARFVCSAASGEMGHMEPTEAFELLQTEGWTFVDCRTEEEFAAGHVEGSINIPVVFFSDMGMTPNAKFVEQLNAAVPDKEVKLIMGCKIGQRSMMASQLALNDQYEEVHNMTGGMMQWVSSGLPIKE